MKVNIYDKNLKKTDSTKEVSDSVWGKRMNEDLVAQAVYVYRSNLRQGTASAKTRSEVSGGGKKPWSQKGTGRARAGSSRSPIWVGGGRAFTPTNRNWDRKLNKKMKMNALSCVLSKRLADEGVIFVNVEELSRDSIKGHSKVLVVSNSEKAFRAIRNVEGVQFVRPEELNAYVALRGNVVVIDIESVDKLEARYADGK